MAIGPVDTTADGEQGGSRRVGEHERGSDQRRLLRVALVNNMPDGAFRATHERFRELLGATGPRASVELRGYAPARGLCPDAARRLGYRRVEDLLADPPDAMVVTGTEPTATDLTAEPYWSSLAELLRWATATVPSTMLSCLASHAALLALDGVARRRLVTKLSGVVSERVDTSCALHPIVAGLGPAVAFPHSRWHDVDAAELRSHGYDVLTAAPTGCWSVAARATGDGLLVLLQGHPEYGPTTLLGEYRRDVDRFVQGTAPTYPEVPSGYLDAQGAALLERLRSEHLARRGSGLPVVVTVDDVAEHVVASWESQATRLFANWVADARRRVAAMAA